MYSALIRRFLQNSTALAESRPRVELSQHCRGAPDSDASAMETRFRLGRCQHWSLARVWTADSLATTDTADEVVAYIGVDGVADTEDSHCNVAHVLGILASGQVGRRVRG